MAKPKPIVVHIRALVACGVFLGIGGIWSWIFPLSSLHFTRVAADRVDCVVEQRLLGVVVFKQFRLSDVQRISLSHDAARRGNGGLDHLNLLSGDGSETSVSASGYADSSVTQFNAFVKDDHQKDLRLWAMSLFGYATALVAVPAVLLTLAVVWNLIVNQAAWLTHAPEQLVVEERSNGGEPSQGGEHE